MQRYLAKPDILLERDVVHGRVRVKGDLDVAALPVVREALSTAAGGDRREIALLLAGARLVDTPTVETFATMVHQLGVQGCPIVLHGLSPLQESILRTYGVDRFAGGEQLALAR